MNIISTNLIKRLIYSFIIPVFAMAGNVYMPADSTSAEAEILQERKRLVILPVDTLRGHVEISLEVGRIVAGVAAELGRFEIIDRNDLQQIIQEQDLALFGLVNDSDAVRLGQIAGAQEALRVSIVSFSQIGVAPKDDDDDGGAIFGAIIKGLVKIAVKDKSDIEKWPNNINTELRIEIRHLDLETGKSLNSIIVEGSHTGGTKGKSRSKAINQVRNRVRIQLRRLYMLESTVVSINDQQVILPFGSDIGVRRGMIFEIAEPDQISQFGTSSIKIPGKTVAYVKTLEVADSGSRSIVMRQWGPIKPGYRVDELLRPIITSSLALRKSLNDEGLEIGTSFLANGSGGFYFGLGLGFVAATDRRSERDSGVSTKAIAGLRLKLSSRLVIAPELNLGFNAYFKSDDADDSATATATSALVSLGASAEYMLGQHIDFVAGAGYDFGGTTGKWLVSGSDDEDSSAATWNGDQPDIDTGGLYFNVGLRYLFTLPTFPWY